VSFDPFGDFATKGYLRNVEKEKDLDIVKRLEHASFTTGLDEAFTALGKSKQLSIDAPSKGHLDNYLKQFIRDPISLEELAAQVITAPGLDGRTPAGDENEVVGNIDAPEVKAQYEAMLLKRGKTS
jgi:hypothetical protein